MIHIERLRRRYSGHEWEPVEAGRSGAGVWRLTGTPSYFVKADGNRDHAGLSLRGEAERLAWLRASGVPVPEVVEQDADDDVAWLVTTVVPGRTAADDWPRERHGALVDALAGFTRDLHTIPAGTCPFDRTLAVTVPEAREIAEAGLVDLDDLDDERAGWSADRLVAELAATTPASEDLVVCHGDLCLPNVLLDPETLRVTGVVDVGRAGVADRCQDLALMTRSLTSGELNPQYGPACADRFLARYGVAPDPSKIAFYRLLDEFF
ncbi:APH(3') family aminoglycoside O-phosphotransferase [Bailinhaonella thermotolerans]|uniref:Aminoglycoside 3'-phosphotransferase n=1 Tax=Bailinhaonella thermotolerans TaxID=1070861 RepID=A0A3A4AU57_9ACTN|nr:APH(3') family aminoglycoside O-phosphotransferase [Bailinhaonella thermotolerans]RJL33085.1 aminoglycoside 3'-phosphotransferase [Bailinhaonella thermotolerans]